MSLLWIALFATQSEGAAPRALTLAEAVELALAAEPAIAVAEISSDQASLSLHRAELDRLSVKIDAQLGELYNASNIGADAGASALLGLSNLSAGVTVPIYTGGRVTGTIDRARALVQATEEELLVERRAAALATARAYWAVRKVGLLAEVQARAMERLLGAEQIARSRVSAGLAPPIDENRAIARRMREDAALAALEGQRAEVIAELSLLLGAGEERVPTDPPLPPEEALPELPELLARASTRRPELRAALARASAEAHAVELARSGYYPQVEAYGLLQGGNNPLIAGVGSRTISDSANPFGDLAADFQAGLNVSINLFDTFRTETAVQEAQLALERAQAEHRRITRSIEREVRAARARAGRLGGVRARLLPAERIARDNVEIVKRRYENGDALVFELLDSELELLEIERQLTETTADLRLAWIELEAAAGTIPGEQR